MMPVAVATTVVAVAVTVMMVAEDMMTTGQQKQQGGSGQYRPDPSPRNAFEHPRLL
jgi:hypothetical protein